MVFEIIGSDENPEENRTDQGSLETLIRMLSDAFAICPGILVLFYILLFLNYFFFLY